MKYLVIIEENADGYTAYTPDIDGCVVCGPSADFVEREIRQSITRRLYELKREHPRPPCPRSYPQYVSVFT